MDEHVNHVRSHDDDGNGNVKKYRFNEQNINSARASRFFCTFLYLQCTTTT